VFYQPGIPKPLAATTSGRRIPVIGAVAVNRAHGGAAPGFSTGRGPGFMVNGRRAPGSSRRRGPGADSVMVNRTSRSFFAARRVVFGDHGLRARHVGMVCGLRPRSVAGVHRGAGVKAHALF